MELDIFRSLHYFNELNFHCTIYIYSMTHGLETFDIFIILYNLGRYVFKDSIS